MTPPTRPVRAAALGCAAALTLLVCCGCSTPAAGDGPLRRAVGAVLDARARAVGRHDRAAFLATVDPAASRFRAAQAVVFDNLRRLPFASWSYRVRSTGAFPVAGRQQTAVTAELDYRLRGYDTAPVTGDTFLTMTRRAGHWYLSAQNGAEQGREATAQPWDLGPLTVVTGRRSLVLGQGTPAVLRGYADLADAAVPVVGAAWPGGWRRRAIVEVPGSRTGMAALLGASPDAYRSIAAVTTAELRGGGSAPADRVIVNPEAFAGLSAFGRRVVLTHELTHVATRTATTSATPLWLSEGFADWVGYGGSGRSPRSIAPELARDTATGEVPDSLPSAADFAGTAARLPQAYEEAWLACRLIADVWGKDRLVALYRAAGRQGERRALRGVLGVDTAGFTARWRTYLAKELA